MWVVEYEFFWTSVQNEQLYSKPLPQQLACPDFWTAHIFFYETSVTFSPSWTPAETWRFLPTGIKVIQVGSKMQRVFKVWGQTASLAACWRSQSRNWTMSRSTDWHMESSYTWVHVTLSLDWQVCVCIENQSLQASRCLVSLRDPEWNKRLQAYPVQWFIYCDRWIPRSWAVSALDRVLDGVQQPWSYSEPGFWSIIDLFCIPSAMIEKRFETCCAALQRSTA